MLIAIVAGALTLVILVFVKLRFTTLKYADPVRFPSERKFRDPATNQDRSFPSLYDEASKTLSVVVPAYNEEQRLPTMLNECMDYLEDRCKIDKNFSYEVIVVDDGSTDKTTEVAEKYVSKYGCDRIRVLKLEKNRGKGGAVRLGVLSSRGNFILFADADGATYFPDLSKLEVCMDELLQKSENGSSGLAIVCGSRAHLEQEAIATRSVFRNLLMHGFHALVWLFAVRTVRDTQCGFKLFSRRGAMETFPSIHVERWAFDVELLFLAEKMQIPIGEVAVKWTEIDGSKVVPVFSWLQMGRDLFLIWLYYTLGLWAPLPK